MTQIDDILDRLKGQQPELENPDEMLESIMASLPDRVGQETRSEESESAKPHLILRVLRTITSAAAILLIGLFIYVNQPVKTEAPRTYDYTTDLPHSSTLENMYTRYLQASQPKPISYTQIKRMLYAKN
jgi:hypothetical protein